MDVETSGEKRSDTADPRRAKFVCAAMANDDYQAMTMEPPTLKRGAKVVVHCVPYDGVVLGAWDVEWDDTKLVAHLAGEEDTTLKGLTMKKLGRLAMTYEEALAADKLAPYCLADAINTWDLLPVLRDGLPAKTLTLYDELEKPLLPLWVKMTLEGSFRVDRGPLGDYREWLAGEVEQSRRDTQGLLPRGRVLSLCLTCGQLKETVETGERCDGGAHHKWKGGEKFVPDYPVNLDSPDQVLVALQAVGVPIQGSTGEEVLEGFRAGYPVVDALLQYRGQVKTLSTYVDPWLSVPTDTLLGAVWRPSGVRNGGRVSSAYPNLQNIPVVLEKYLLAGEGYVKLELDNAQLEIRAAAELSQDRQLMEACRSTDFHAEMQQVLGYSDRRDVKIAVFKAMYDGRGTEEMRRRMPTYFRWAADQRGRRVVEGLFGRMHYIPPPLGDSWTERARSDRQAVNDPIQGGGGTVLKYQMLALWRAGFHIVRQVHDSVTMWVRPQERDGAAVIAKRIMEDVMRGKMETPIQVEVK